MRRTARLLLIALAALAATLGAQAPTPQPVFRGGTDLVQVDVSVLDGKRHPVRGLTAADFSIFEDGQPRDVQAFTEVNLPDRGPAQDAAWTREVPPDVATNQTTQDDGRAGDHPARSDDSTRRPTLAAKRIAAAMINQIGPAISARSSPPATAPCRT